MGRGLPRPWGAFNRWIGGKRWPERWRPVQGPAWGGGRVGGGGTVEKEVPEGDRWQWSQQQCAHAGSAHSP